MRAVERNWRITNGRCTRGITKRTGCGKSQGGWFGSPITCFRLSRQRIQAFIDEWLGIWIGTGTIHNTLAEAAVIVAPLEQELVDGILQSDLLHADETPWPEQGASALWLWVFITSRVVLYYISHRGRELVRNLLDGLRAY